MAIDLQHCKQLHRWSSYLREGRTVIAATPIFTCVCGTQRKTSNHWILALQTPQSVQFVPWDAKLALSDAVVVLCGEGCAAALLSRSLGDWNEATKNAAASILRAA